MSAKTDGSVVVAFKVQNFSTLSKSAACSISDIMIVFGSRGEHAYQQKTQGLVERVWPTEYRVWASALRKGNMLPCTFGPRPELPLADDM